MANRRTPASLAKMTGAAIKNPKRHASRAEPKAFPLGAPPARMSDSERLAWVEFSEEMPWLAKSDRALVEVACRLKGRMIADPEMGVQALAQLRMCVSSMGGTPADRSKVMAPNDDDDQDPSAEFLN